VSENRWQRHAWIVIIIADAGWLLWGLMAALAPEHLAGPRTASIVVDGYEGFTGGSWSALVATSPRTAGFIMLVFRLYGAMGAVFCGLAIAICATAYRRREPWAWWMLLVGNTIAFALPMTYDRIVHAIGPFEVTEYLGLALVWGALAVTAPFRAAAPAEAAALPTR
jgi:hypothetical protein